MTNGAKASIASIAVVILAVGGEALYLHHRNVVDQTLPAATKSAYVHDPDDDVFLHREHPMSLADEKSLKGKTLWVSAGGQMEYYPVAGGHTVDYARPAGLLLGAEPIVVTDAIEAVAPKKAAFRIPQGDRQILLVFTKPAAKPATSVQYAVPVGFRTGTDTSLSTDEIFFYEDPHKLFAYWSPDIWHAIDEHRAIPGMNERQVQMALGQVSDPKGDTVGDRVVVYDNNGHPISVTFRAGKAVTLTPEKS